MEKEVILVGGLGFGDEGKGSIVDYLVRTKKAKVVVRFNGGAQAGHNVVNPDGRHHTFSQFGSGMFVPGVKTHLSRFMILNPLSMMKEEEHLQSVGVKDAFQRTTIDEEALVTTPFQIAVNRLREIWRGDKRHGSCGIGIGQTIEDYQKYGDRVLFAKDLRDPGITAKKLEFLQKQSCDAVRDLASGLAQTEVVKRELDWLEDKTAIDDLAAVFLYFVGLVKIVNGSYLEELIRGNRVVIFEGAQGALLDKDYGFYPYITKTNTTFANADELLRSVGYDGKVTRVGILRSYATRHGLGPFVTEDSSLQKLLQDPHNHNLENRWQGRMRFGRQDLLALRYAIMANGVVDCLAVTNMDQVARLPEIKICVSYEYKGRIIDTLDDYFEWGYTVKNGVRIISFKKPLIHQIRNCDELSTLLLRCKPLDFLKFSCLEEYIDFLQSKDGLNTPIKIISTGPTWKEKMLLTKTGSRCIILEEG